MTRLVPNTLPFFIAEVSSNHQRDLKRSLSFIEVAAEIGCQAVKFQLFKIDQLFSKDAKKLFKSALKKTKRELPRGFIPKISNYCRKKKNKIFLHAF